MDDEERRLAAARRFWDRLAVTTEHQDITKVQAFREMCEAAIAVYDGTEDQHVADWARDALRGLPDS
jgi:hypothetical protein